MELYFSCLIRKAVRFGSDAQAGNFAAATPQLKVGFRPVMTRACRVSEMEGEPPLEDFAIVRPEAFVPKPKWPQCLVCGTALSLKQSAPHPIRR